jgi:hypothetical protein
MQLTSQARAIGPWFLSMFRATPLFPHSLLFSLLDLLLDSSFQYAAEEHFLGKFSATEEENGLSSSSEPALQNSIVCFGFVPCSQWAETLDFQQAWNMKSLTDLKHKISEGSETWDFWQSWKHDFFFDRSEKTWDFWQIWKHEIFGQICCSAHERLFQRE